MNVKKIESDMVIHCKTKEEATQLIEMTNSKKRFIDYWEGHKENTCYRIKKGKVSGFGSYDTYNTDYFIKEFSDLIIPELSTEEVLEIRNDLPFDFVREYLGLCYGRSLDEMLRMAKPAQIIDMCIKWKEEHIEPKIERLTVGDIVFCKGKKINVAIVKVYNENGVQIYKGLGEDGQAYGFMEHEVNKSITRTGRKIDISSILAEIGKVIKHE